MATDMQLSGFPPGYFVIRSLATGRLWDVSGDAVEDGAEVVLWPEKEHSLVESEYILYGFSMCSLTQSFDRLEKPGRQQSGLAPIIGASFTTFHLYHVGLLHRYVRGAML